ncbi:MAG: hypothetical protein K0S27_1087 [Gammaproteobacteria bacterium]|jgi:hypothetical protein|nr:hypothetical protein [Gammaproteobacteria bacterium]
MHARSHFPITQVVCIGEGKDQSQVDKLRALYPQEKRRADTIYIMIDRRPAPLADTRTKVLVSTRWPALYLDQARRPEHQSRAGQWLRIPACHDNLAALEEGCSRDINVLSPMTLCEEVLSCQKKMETHLEKTREKMEDQVPAASERIQTFFSLEEEKKIKEFFGRLMLCWVKELRTFLFKGRLINNNEKLNFENAHPNDILNFDCLVTALKATPSRKMSPAEASTNEACRDIATAAVILKSRLELDKKSEEGLIIQRRLCGIVGMILLVAPGALVGLTAAGGAVGLSFVATGVGGFIGGLVGGSLGAWASELTTSRYAQAWYANQIDDAVKEKGIIEPCPPPAFR